MAEIQIVPSEECYVEACARISVGAWERIHEAYRACMGDQLHDAIMSNWRQQKAEGIRRQQRGENAFVALSDGDLAGFIAYHTEGQVGEIVGNALSPAYLGQGIAQKMYSFVLDRMRKEGLRYARVNTGGDDGHAPARRAYERAGFSQPLLRRRYYAMLSSVSVHGSDAVQIMPMQLSQIDRCVEIAIADWANFRYLYPEMPAEVLDDVFGQAQDRRPGNALSRKLRKILTGTMIRQYQSRNSLVAILNGRVVGFLTYSLYEDDGNVDRYAVDPVYEKCGILGSLCAYAVAEMRTKAIVHISMVTKDAQDTAEGIRVCNAMGMTKYLPNRNYYMVL